MSRVTKVFMDRGVIVRAQLTSKHYRRSPIVQGGMEIFCGVAVKIPGTCVNILLMEQNKQLVQQLYIEPKNEEILGSFLQANETIDGVKAHPVSKKAKVKKKKNKAIRQLTDKKKHTSFF